MQKKCEICNKMFEAKRDHAKYCSKCQKQASNRRVYKHRHYKKDIKPTIEDLKCNPKHASNYEKLMKALNDNDKWSDLKKATGFDNDKLSFYVRQFRINGILEPKSLKKRNEYNLSAFFKFEPIMLWHKDYIDSIPPQQIILGENSAIFLKNLSRDNIDGSENKNIRKSIQDLKESYFKFCQSLWKIGLRLANEIWIEFIKNMDASNETKIYYWLEMLRVHFLATDRCFFIGKGDRRYRKGMIHPIVLDLYSSLKFNEFKHSHVPWSIEFTKLIRKGVKEVNQNEILHFRRQFNKVCKESLETRIKKEDFITIMRSETLIHYRHIEKLEKIDKAMEEKTKKSPKMLRLKKIDFCKGMDKEIQDLEFTDRQHFYDELQYLADSFSFPMLKKDKN